MAFFDDLTKMAKDVATVAADKTKDAAEQVKLSVAIAGEQKEIDKNYRTIGEWFVNEYEGEIPDAVRELVDAVTASKAKIAELQKQLRELEAAKTEQENLQIIQLVRGLNMKPEEFAAFLRGGALQSAPAPQPDFEQEDNANEE